MEGKPWWAVVFRKLSRCSGGCQTWRSTRDASRTALYEIWGTIPSEYRSVSDGAHGVARSGSQPAVKRRWALRNENKG